MYDFIKRMYLNGTYTDSNLGTLESKGFITEEQKQEIIASK
ncbi:XkdX family protein [Peribacillus sp. JNUCC 23]